MDQSIREKTPEERAQAQQPVEEQHAAHEPVES